MHVPTGFNEVNAEPHHMLARPDDNTRRQRSECSCLEKTQKLRIVANTTVNGSMATHIETFLAGFSGFEPHAQCR